MNAFTVSDLKVGMRFDKPVYIDSDTLFVPENVEIRDRDIDRLRMWNIESVLTDGKPIADDESEGEQGPADPFLASAFTSSEYRKVISFYRDLTKRMTGVFDAVKNRASVTTDEIDQIVDGLNGELRGRRDELIQYILYGLHGASSFEQNALNCAALCILIGREMGITDHKIVELATAGLLHDIGMVRLPESIVNKSGKLSAEELQQVKTHPIHSYKIIVRELRYSDSIGQAALQHQERWDGAGYPKGLRGEQIVLHARLISVADAFEAMISKRPYRDPMIGYRAMRTILSDNGRRFDPEVLKVFIQTMGLYPLGSVVLLSNAAVGRVIAVNRGAPLRPKVKIMIDETGAESSEKDDGEVIDLNEYRRLFIVRSVDPKDIASSRNQVVDAE